MEQQQTNTVKKGYPLNTEVLLWEVLYSLCYAMSYFISKSFHEATDEQNLDILEFINECFLFKTI